MKTKSLTYQFVQSFEKDVWRSYTVFFFSAKEHSLLTESSSVFWLHHYSSPCFPTDEDEAEEDEGVGVGVVWGFRFSRAHPKLPSHTTLSPPYFYSLP